MKSKSTSLENSRLLTLLTDLGWVGICHRSQTILGVKFGYDNHAELVRQFDENVVQVHRPSGWEEHVLDLFENYCNGAGADFSELKIDESSMTPFQRKVTRACRRIPSGKTLSYGRLAAKAGSPRAARAVGSVMSNNGVPLIVPCHRVVSSAGIGGFSSPRGVSMKQKLLNLESVELVGS